MRPKSGYRETVRPLIIIEFAIKGSEKISD
jgi:hypothetical protein